MNPIRQHTLKFIPLSPVHIGCGETYEPTNYVIDDDALYEFDPHTGSQNLAPNERQRLLNIANGRPDQNMIKAIQSFFHQNREAFMLDAKKFVPVQSGVIALYNERIGKTAQNEEGGRQILNKLEIERTSFVPGNRNPYFPGSSIKGAIRTALLDRINNKQAKPDLKNQELQQHLFKYSIRELHKDPMRLVSIADAQGCGTQELPSSRICFAVNRKKHPVQVDGKTIQSKAEQKGLYQLLECIPGFSDYLLNGSINFQTNLDGYEDQLPDKDLHWDIRDIVEACNRFYLPLLEKEMNLLAERNYLDRYWHDQMDTLLKERNLRQASDCFLLRLGRHSGAEAMTIAGRRNIKITQGQKEKPTYEKESKTVWLASPEKDSKQDLLPFGWVLVEVDAANDPISGSLTINNPALESWNAKTKNKIVQLRIEHEKRIAVQREQAEAERRKQLEEENRQREFENKIQSLSPLAQELERQVQNANWESNKNAFWAPGQIESWIDKLEQEPDPAVLDRLSGLFERHFPGALKNPDKTQGKKQKPVFGDRIRKLAKVLNSIRSRC